MATTTLPPPADPGADDRHAHAELHELLTELVHLARLGQADKEDPWTVLHALERLALEAFDAADGAEAAEHGAETKPNSPDDRHELRRLNALEAEAERLPLAEVAGYLTRSEFNTRERVGLPDNSTMDRFNVSHDCSEQGLRSFYVAIRLYYDLVLARDDAPPTAEEQAAAHAKCVAAGAYAEPAAEASAEPAPNPGRAIDDLLSARSLCQLIFAAARVQDTVPSGEAIQDACNMIHGHLDAALEALGEKEARS